MANISELGFNNPDELFTFMIQLQRYARKDDHAMRLRDIQSHLQIIAISKVP